MLAGTVCALAALRYAELAAMVPAAGSAYTYTFATLGQLIAFERLGRTHERYGTPRKITLITIIVVAALAGFVPLATLAELVNIGTLFAFMLVAAGVLFLRSADPDREPPFRTPLVSAVPILAIAGCICLAVTLPADTWLRFLGWMGIGIVVYVLYARRSSAVGLARDA